MTDHEYERRRAMKLGLTFQPRTCDVTDTTMKALRHFKPGMRVRVKADVRDERGRLYARLDSVGEVTGVAAVTSPDFGICVLLDGAKREKVFAPGQIARAPKAPRRDRGWFRRFAAAWRASINTGPRYRDTRQYRRLKGRIEAKEALQVERLESLDAARIARRGRLNTPWNPKPKHARASLSPRSARRVHAG